MTQKNIMLFLRCAVIITVLVIFGFSLQNGEESTQQSDWFAEQIQAAVDFVEDSIGVEVNVRKIGHFSEFALLGVETMLLYLLSGKRKISELFNVFGLGLTTAVTDESIQLFVPERSGQIRDVQIDMAGFICGAVLLCGVYYLVRFIRKKYSVKEGKQNGK